MNKHSLFEKTINYESYFDDKDILSSSLPYKGGVGNSTIDRTVYNTYPDSSFVGYYSSNSYAKIIRV